ncbi:MAG: T9SS type A sorting domain-containing protein, partial [Chitinophagaceae bacterium]|nr:T9SS type A sorting domain-containing protein [Chitinophagaceae bacterium]
FYFLFIIAPVCAQTPINPYTWTGSPASAAGPSAFTTLPASITPGAATVNVSQWNRGAVVFNAAAACYNSNNWQVGGSLALAQANNRCVFFTVVNSGTTELQVTRILIRSQVSATGPQNVQLTSTIGASTSTYGLPIATAHSATPEDWDFSDNLCIAAGQTATFRLYGWGATSTAGTLRINDGTAIVAGFAPALVSTAGSTSPVCEGSGLSLLASATGGVPGYSYLWTGPGGFSSTMANPVIAPAPIGAAGTYTLVVSDVLNCSTSSSPASTTVTVNATPAAITGPATVCPLLTASYSSATTGGSWTSGDLSVATIGGSTGILVGVAPGTAVITYTLPTGCFSTRTVMVSTPPGAISGTSTYCIGDTGALSALPVGGAWSSSSPLIASVGALSGTVTALAAGTSIITYTDGGGCISLATVTVLASPGLISLPGAVCEGQSVSATIGTTGGLWSSSDVLIASVGSASGIVTGVNTGIVNMTYTLPTGCFSVRSITVNPLPATPTGSLASCVGSVISLSSSTPGGTWSSSLTSVATVGSLSGSVTPIAAGTTIISYTLLSTGCGAGVIFTTNPLPAAITGPSSVCVGDSVLLSNSFPGGTWESANTSIATVSSASGWLTGSLAGTVRITYRLVSTGCFTVRLQTVNPLPSAIVGPSSVCVGLSVSLSSAPSGGAWSIDNPLIASIAVGTGSVTGLLAGTAIVSYITTVGCRTTRLLTVNPAPTASVMVIGDTALCPGDFVILTASSATGISYQWFDGITSISGATTPIYTATATGNYRVRVLNSLSCPGFSTAVSVSVNSVTASITIPVGTTSSCSGTPIVLAATTGAGYTYQWLMGGSPIAGATSATYAATSSSDYSVRITNSTGCTDVSTPVTLSFIPGPDATLAVSGPLSFCSGGSVTMLVPGVTGVSYQWFNGSTPIASATNNTYTATTTGNYSCVVTNPAGCSDTSSATAVIVNSLPNPVINTSGPTTVCPGSGVTLSAITGASLQYQWYKGGVAIPGGTSSSYYASLSGGYRVRVTNGSTGCTAMTVADTIVTVLSSLTVTALTPSSFCWGGSSILATNLSIATLGYQWNKGGVNIVGATSSTYAASDPGFYNCKVSIAGSCTLTGTSVEVRESPLPDPSIVRIGSRLLTQDYYITYQWYKDLVPIYGATNYSLTSVTPGQYKVRVTDTNGCQAVSATFVMMAGSPTEIENVVSDDPYVVFPSPTSGIFSISPSSIKEVLIYNALGTLVFRSPAKVHYDLTSMSSGVYSVVIVETSNALIHRKLIISR